MRWREQRALAYSVTAFNIEGLAPGVFGVYLGTDPSSVDEAVTATQTELERVRTQAVAPQELEQAKKYMTGSYEISLQSNAAQSEELAFNELYGLGHNHGRALLGTYRTRNGARHPAGCQYLFESSRTNAGCCRPMS